MVSFAMLSFPSAYINNPNKIPYFGSKTPPKSLPVSRNSSYLNLESNAQKREREAQQRIEHQNANQELDRLDKQFNPTFKEPKYQSSFKNRQKKISLVPVEFNKS